MSERYGVSANGQHWQGWAVVAGKRHKFGLGPMSEMSRRSAMFRAHARAVEIATGADKGGGVPISTWMQTYRGQNAHRLADSTLKLFDHTAKLIGERYGTSTPVHAIKPVDAMDFPRWLTAEKKMGDSSVWGVVRRAKTIFAAAEDAELVARNPFRTVSAPAPGSSAWEYVGADVLERILQACPNDSWRAVFALARHAGLRANEIESLAWADIDWQARTMTIHPRQHRETTKKRLRVCPIIPTLHAELVRIRDAHPASEKPTHQLGACNRNRDARRILKSAGVGDYGKTLHALRKSLESDWISKYPIADVCAWLGNSPAVAMQFYHRPTPDSVAKLTQI